MDNHRINIKGTQKAHLTKTNLLKSSKEVNHQTREQIVKMWEKGEKRGKRGDGRSSTVEHMHVHFP